MLVLFSSNEFSMNTQFDPESAGMADITLVTPAGFETPANDQKITATVTSAKANISNATVGEDLLASVFVSLESPPPAPVAVTVTSNDPTIVKVTKDMAVMGAGSVTFTNVTSTNVGNVSVEGRAGCDDANGSSGRL